MHWGYVGWLIWSNLITLLSIVQMAVAGIMIYAEAFPHTTFRWLVIANAALTAIVAQVKKNAPPGPPPQREDDRNAVRDVDSSNP